MGYTDAMLQISYPKLPRLLVIQLKRFSGGMEKINSHIPTPFTLQCFCTTCYKKENAPKEHEYSLYSVITHVGATMCAGHYIAYTTSLNLNSTYTNCPQDATRKEAQGSAAAAAAAAAVATAFDAAPAGAAAAAKSSSSNSKLASSMKKILTRNKNNSSNSADPGKSQKNLNGVKNITNGVDNVQIGNSVTSSSTTTSPTSAAAAAPPICPSIKCCSIKMKTLQSLESSTIANGSNGSSISNGNEYSSHSRNNSLSSVYSDQYTQPNPANAPTVKPNTEQIWYMCDDDKIKAIPQQNFKEMLQPNKKNMITPYLLFYARNDIFQSPQ